MLPRRALRVEQVDGKARVGGENFEKLDPENDHNLGTATSTRKEGEQMLHTCVCIFKLTAFLLRVHFTAYLWPYEQ